MKRPSDQLGMFDAPADGFIGTIRVVGARRLRGHAWVAADALESRKQVIVHCTTRGTVSGDGMRVAPGEGFERSYIFSPGDASLAVGPGAIQAVLRVKKVEHFVCVLWKHVRYIEVVDDGVEQPFVDPQWLFRMLESDARDLLALYEERGGDADVGESLRRALRKPERFCPSPSYAHLIPFSWENPERQRRTAAVLAEIERDDANDQPPTSRAPFIPGDEVRFTAKWLRFAYGVDMWGGCDAPDRRYFVQRCDCANCTSGRTVAVPATPAMAELYGPLRHILSTNLEHAQLAPAGPVKPGVYDALLAQVGMRIDEHGHYFLRPPWEL